MWPFDKINCFDHLIAKNETLRIENEKLKKKNKTLSEENQELIKWMRYSRFPFPPKKHYIPEYDGCVDPETNCLKREILFLQTKNEKLDDNLKRARREADCRSHRVKELEHKIGELNTLMEKERKQADRVIQANIEINRDLAGRMYNAEKELKMYKKFFKDNEVKVFLKDKEIDLNNLNNNLNLDKTGPGA